MSTDTMRIIKDPSDGILCLGSVWGAQIKVHRSCYLMAALTFLVVQIFATLAFSATLFYALSLAAVAAITLVAINVVHELGHVWAGALYGLCPQEVVLLGWGARTSYGCEVHNPRHYAVVSLAGPGANLIAAVLGLIPVVVWGTESLASLALLFSAINVLYAALNLVPVYPRDGGRIFHALLWLSLKDENRSESWCRYCSLAFILCFLMLCLMWGRIDAAIVTTIIGGESIAHDMMPLLRKVSVSQEIW